MKTTRAVVGTLLAFGAIFFFGNPTAVGQDGAPYNYQPLFGDLDVEGTDFTVGSMVVLSGDGFAPLAPVQLRVRPNDSADLTSDTDGEATDDGAVRMELVLSSDFSAGSYTATLRGPAVDGATVELSAVILVSAPPAPTPVPATPVVAPTPTTQVAVPPPPTATPLPDPGLRNERPTEIAAPDPTTGIDVSAERNDAAAADGTGSAGEDDGSVATGNGDDAAAGNDDTDDEDDEEVAGGPLPGDDNGSGWGALRWGGVVAALIVIVTGFGVLRRNSANKAAAPRRKAD